MPEPMRKVEPWFRRLYMPAYQVSDAARYARTPLRTVTYWHYHGGSLGPALQHRTKRQPLSYLELVEVAFVATMRHLGLTLQRIRRARQYVAQTFNSEYPFAEYRFKTEGMHLLMELSEFETDLKAKGTIVADLGGQLGWEQVMVQRFLEFDYESVLSNGHSTNLALRWHVAGPNRPIVIDPRIAFGAPIVRGVPTWAIRGRYRAGEEILGIKEEFALEEEEVRQALEFEGEKIAA